MTAVLVKGLFSSEKDAARWLGVSIRTARRYRAEGIPRARLHEFTDRLAAMVDARFAQLAEWESAIHELRRGDAASAVDARRAGAGLDRLAVHASRRAVSGKSGPP